MNERLRYILVAVIAMLIGGYIFDFIAKFF